MTSGFSHRNCRRWMERRSSATSLESLEPRQLLSSISITSAPLISSLASGTPEVISRSITVVTSPDTADTFDVSGTNAALSVRGVSSTTTATLRYVWTTTQVPVSGSVAYSLNNSFTAKDTVLTFTRAGSYSVRVSIFSGATLVSVSSMNMNVLQKSSKVVLIGPLNRTISSGATIAFTTTVPTLTATALDQFSQRMASQPDISWTVVTAPAGGTASLSTSNNSVTATVNKAGVYGLRATSGTIINDVSLSSSQVLTSMTLATSAGTVSSDSGLLSTKTTSQSVALKCFDQYNNPMTSTPSITWTTVSAPTGGSAVTRLASGVATVTTTRAGRYSIRGTSGAVSVQFQFTAEATFTRISVRTAENREVLSNGTLSVASTASQLSAVGLDQFGQTLIEQPEIVWTSTAVPSGGKATLTATGNSIAAAVNKTGAYGLRATSGSLSTTFRLSFSQVLTSLSTLTPGGVSIDPAAPLVTRTSTQSVQVKAFDQFGNSMVSIPAITWTTTSAPIGGSAVTKLANGSATATFTRAGTYEIRGAVGSLSVTFQVIAEAALSRISLRTVENKDIASNGTVTSAGTAAQFGSIALDQFNQPLTEQPAITWLVQTSPTGGTALLTAEKNSVAASVNKAGTYVLRATAGVVFSNITLKINQLLTTINLSTSAGEVDPNQALVTTKTTQSVNVRCGDQFGNPMAAAPSITWTTLSAATGGSAVTKLASGIATVTMTRAGTYSIRGVSGALSVNFQVTAEATLSRVSVRTVDNREVLSNGTVSIASTTTQLSALGLDQFNQVLASQPEIVWSSTTVASGGSATLTATGSSIAVTGSKAGAYGLRATSGSIFTGLTVTFSQVFSSFSLAALTGEALSADSTLNVTGTSSAIALRVMDQFGNSMITLPSIKWNTTQAPTGGTAIVKVSGSLATATFNRVGRYAVRAAAGGHVVTASFQVIPTLQSIIAVGADGRSLSTSAITVTSTSARATLTGLDQFRLPLATQPEFTWSVVSASTGGTVSFTNDANSSTAEFSKAGSYSLLAAFEAVRFNVNYSVIQTLTSLNVTPGTLTVPYSAVQQFITRGLDQFETAMLRSPTIVWSATGGIITTAGHFTAGSQAGLYTVTATAGALTQTVSITIIAPAPPVGLLDAELAALVDSYYVDGQISRTEMISVLRSAGSDGMVSATELADFRFLVSADTPFVMPGYVQGLATDVVNSSPANLKYKGQTAGNLTAGSSSVLLNNLVDKWFFGTDDPTLTSGGLTYQTSTGTLFNGTPSRADARQGMLGDCYLIAAVAAIADRNPDAVRNMFVDNEDGTYTVRFYVSGVADYVTVSRRLPTMSSGGLAYSGYGLSAASGSTTLWIALAEKAYAQWNETGNEGRDGTNRYSAIEGGWMGYVNAQVLGTPSSNHGLTSTPKQTLITALNSQKAVTIGTNQFVSAGLYGSHAYIVTSYDSSTDTFRLHNPWGNSHPGALTYSQLQAFCSMFVVADATESTALSSTSGTFTASRPLSTVVSSTDVLSSAYETSPGIASIRSKGNELQPASHRFTELPADRASDDTSEMLDSIPGSSLSAEANSAEQLPTSRSGSHGALTALDCLLLDLIYSELNAACCL